uniref:HIT domain-containing protein n=1 Tax=Oscillibacter sp. TaxID=1945593 RepID=UPI00289B9E62
MSDCLFCKIAAGEIPSDKLYEDEVCFAFSDIAPQAPSHFLVIPKSHIASVSQIDGSNSALDAHIFEVIAKLTAEK